MKLAISNIAWTADEEPAVAAMLVKLGIKGVEVAPPRVWPDPLKPTKQQLRDYRRFWNDNGIEIVSLQSLLFGRQDLRLFDSDQSRNATIDYLRKMIDLAQELGAGVLVFGSPKNRVRGALESAKANEISSHFFRLLGDHAASLGSCFCIEPNAVEYGCDFINTTVEGTELVSLVNSVGFGLHLDAGVLAMNGEVPATLEAVVPQLKHFHISEPFLEQLGTRATEHPAMSQALRERGYNNWISIEMRGSASGSNLERVSEAIEFARRNYNS